MNWATPRWWVPSRSTQCNTLANAFEIVQPLLDFSTSTLQTDGIIGCDDTSSALRNDLDVWLYVKDVLDQLLAGNVDYNRLLPWNWADSHPEAIRTYRVEERRDRSTRQSARRANHRKKTRNA